MNNYALRLPGTNIDPVTSELGRCQQQVQKLPILNPFALFFIFYYSFIYLFLETNLLPAGGHGKSSPPPPRPHLFADEDDVMHHICREIITNNAVTYDE